MLWHICLWKHPIYWLQLNLHQCCWIFEPDSSSKVYINSVIPIYYCYLCQEGYVFKVFCFSWLFAELCETCQNNFHKTWWQGLAWAKEKPIEFWSRSESWDKSISLGKRLPSTMSYILKSRWWQKIQVTKHSQCRYRITALKIYPDIWS